MPSVGKRHTQRARRVAGIPVELEHALGRAFDLEELRRAAAVAAELLGGKRRSRAREQKLAEQREQLRLPPGIASLRVENGELVIMQK